MRSHLTHASALVKLCSVKEASHQRPLSKYSIDKEFVEQGKPLGIKVWLAGYGGGEKRSDHQ